MTTKALDLPEREYMLPGNRTCAGCGLSIAYRHILKALDGRAIMTIPASCLTVLGGMYPVSSVEVPVMNCTFPSTAATASGIVAGLKALGKEGITVVAMAGDGGTVDIGIQALSGAAERDTDLLYICYDNEAYMNTGVQRSSATPKGVRTATTPVQGKQTYKKDMPAIMEAHYLRYIATASPAFPEDLYDKVCKARTVVGTRYIHIHAPCPPGWFFPTKETVNVGRLAVETGAFPLYEIDHGTFRLTGRSKTLAARGELKPLHEYLTVQGRFKNVPRETLDELQQHVTERWQHYLERDKAGA
ncbi:MAG TPA: thiamine pyrophosphate-dependent enzyme [Candidatus Hydrogenedentes bacterium]|nr:thiamine pyrophosphate-dependent enzyme [Candidatus Hydrogenedentota bacterium]HPG66236.1 thiamine pyrophosphate-dependent enzyme [Candidatus Hydrogenedentota bacterium]